jgi:purine-binding chemotaxis protein CheW
MGASMQTHKAIDQNAPPGPDAKDIFKVVGFTLADQEHVVDILKVKEIKLMMPITRVPKSSPDLMGVANLRGDIIPVIDLRTRLRLSPATPTDETRIMVIELETHLVGMIVDSVTENYDLRPQDISTAPSSIATVEAAFVRGVAKIGDRLLIFLNIEKLITASDGSASRTLGAARTPAPGV